MVRCQDFYEKVKRDGNFCGMSDRMLKQVEEYMAFMDENPALMGLSERAAQPLMREKDHDVQAKAIETTGRQLSHRPSPTEDQMKIRLANIAAGKDLRGGDHKGAETEEVVPEKKFGDFVEPVEVPVEEKDVEADPVEADHTEIIGDEVYPVIGDVDADTGDIPGMPIEPEIMPSNLPVPPPEPPGVGDEVGLIEVIKPEVIEVTAKITKENLRNAGHIDEKATPKAKRTPTEEEKQRLFNKTIEQALEWGIEGDEIFRRTEKAIVFRLKKSKEES